MAQRVPQADHGTDQLDGLLIGAADTAIRAGDRIHLHHEAAVDLEHIQRQG